MSELKDYKIDAVKGIVYGLRGKPITKRVKGYIHIWNQSPVTSISISAHRLIWTRVHGPIPGHLEINHINGIKSDNRIANLELVTKSENAIHAYRIGLQSASGGKNGRAIGKAKALTASATEAV